MLTVSTVFGFPQNFASRLTITASFWQVHASRVIKRYEATLPFQFFKNIRISAGNLQLPESFCRFPIRKYEDFRLCFSRTFKTQSISLFIFYGESSRKKHQT